MKTPSSSVDYTYLSQCKIVVVVIFYFIFYLFIYLFIANRGAA